MELLTRLNMLTLACLAGAAPLSATITFSGDFNAGEGVITINDPIVLDLGFNSGNVFEPVGILFVDMAPPGTEGSSLFLTEPISYFIDGGPVQTAGNGQFMLRIDDEGFTNDALLNFDQFDLTPHQVLTFPAQTIAMTSTVASSPWPSAASGEFTGGLAISGVNGNLSVPNVNPSDNIPEPAHYAMLGGIAALGLVAWRRRK